MEEGGSLFNYHRHSEHKVTMEKWAAMPEGKDCQRTADLLLREVADELLHRYLHLENVSRTRIMLLYRWGGVIGIICYIRISF